MTDPRRRSRSDSRRLATKPAVHHRHSWVFDSECVPPQQLRRHSWVFDPEVQATITRSSRKPQRGFLGLLHANRKIGLILVFTIIAFLALVRTDYYSSGHRRLGKANEISRKRTQIRIYMKRLINEHEFQQRLNENLKLRDLKRLLADVQKQESKDKKRFAKVHKEIVASLRKLRRKNTEFQERFNRLKDSKDHHRTKIKQLDALLENILDEVNTRRNAGGLHNTMADKLKRRSTVSPKSLKP